MTARKPRSTRPLLPPLVLGAALALMVVLHLVAPAPSLVVWPWGGVLGGTLILLGIALNLWADGLFKRVGTTVKPDELARVLVVDGPYALTRHPMYLGFVLIVVGTACALGSAAPWLVVPVFVAVVRQRYVLPEEAKLTVVFGDRYREYGRRTRRWL